MRAFWPWSSGPFSFRAFFVLFLFIAVWLSFTGTAAAQTRSSPAPFYAALTTGTMTMATTSTLTLDLSALNTAYPDLTRKGLVFRIVHVGDGDSWKDAVYSSFSNAVTAPAGTTFDATNPGETGSLTEEGKERFVRAPGDAKWLLLHHTPTKLYVEFAGD